MNGAVHHPYRGQISRSSGLHLAARGRFLRGSQLFASRSSCAAYLRRSRQVSHAFHHRLPLSADHLYEDHRSSVGSDIGDSGDLGSLPVPVPSPSPASAPSLPGPAPSPMGSGWQWLEGAACCAVAAAVALSLLLSTDHNAAAAATAAATATTAAAAATAAAPARSVPMDVRMLLPAARLRQDGTVAAAAANTTAASEAVMDAAWLLQRQQQHPPPAVLAAPGLRLLAKPTTKPGASGGADVTLYDALYEMSGRRYQSDVTAIGVAGGSAALWDMSQSSSRPVADLSWQPDAAVPGPPDHLHFALDTAARVRTGDGWVWEPSASTATGPDATASASTALASPGGAGGTGSGRSGGAGLLLRVSSSSSSSSTGSSIIGVRGGGGGNELASETEDRLLEVVRQVEARVEGVVGALAGGVPHMLQLGGMQDTSQDAASASAAHALIREVWEVVDNYYLDARATGFNRQHWAELRDEALAVPYRDTAAGYRAIRDMLARGLSDPYCRFIGPLELEAMKKYDVSGVGLNLGTAAEYVIKTGNDLPASRGPVAEGEGVFVVGVSKGSAADLAGVRQGDELLQIQGRSLTNTTPFRAAGLISGAVVEEEEQQPQDTSSSSSNIGGLREQQQQRQEQRRKDSSSALSSSKPEDIVRVKVRHGSGQEEELLLRRPYRSLPSAVTFSLNRSSAVVLPGGGPSWGEELVGTVRLASFNARAQADVAAAVRQLEAAGATRLVLDLRDNRGGLVTEGLEVARLFLAGRAPIVITERRDAPPDTPRAPGPALTSAPLLVLVNGHTASASEIVAGALHDNCRAVLAGSRTYGKGLIQSVYELSDGSGLVITVGKYLTPRGTDIDRYGIKPDYNSVPSGAQYDSTIRACKLAAVYGSTDP